SLSGVALISPDFTASRRWMPPPDSFNVTSLRVRPSRASASVTVESLSEPNVLTPITPPLSSAAIFTPGAEKKVKRMTLLNEPMVRISPPLRLIRMTEDNPTCMTSSRPACSSAAPRLPPLMLMMSTLSPLGGVETGIAGHVPCQHGVDGVGDAGLELDRLLRRRRPPADDNESCNGADAHAAHMGFAWHRDSPLRFFSTLRQPRRLKTPGTAGRIPRCGH